MLSGQSHPTTPTPEAGIGKPTSSIMCLAARWEASWWPGGGSGPGGARRDRSLQRSMPSARSPNRNRTRPWRRMPPCVHHPAGPLCRTRCPARPSRMNAPRSRQGPSSRAAPPGSVDRHTRRLTQLSAPQTPSAVVAGLATAEQEVPSSLRRVDAWGGCGHPGGRRLPLEGGTRLTTGPRQVASTRNQKEH
jgi:hypothetical protein